MGWYFHKGLNFGPIRLNFSKSGIGVSAGVKGFRYSVGPRGAFIHLGAKGIYYSKKVGSSCRSRINSQSAGNNEHYREDNHHTEDGFESFDLIDSSPSELLDEINSNRRLPSRGAGIRSWVVVVACILSMLLPPEIRFYLGFCVLIIGLFYAAQVDVDDQSRRITTMFYELNDDFEKKYEDLQGVCEDLASAGSVKQVAIFDESDDWKNSGGATQAVQVLSTVVISASDTFEFIKTNVLVPCLQFDCFNLYFMPDQLLVSRLGKLFTYSYDSLSIKGHISKYVHSSRERIPRDAERCGTTWQYVNKDGGPDKRHKDNVELPVVLYGYISIAPESGREIANLQVSNTETMKKFCRSLSAITMHYGARSANQSEANNRNQESNSESEKQSRENRSERKKKSERKKQSDGENGRRENKQDSKSVRTPYEVLGIVPGTSVDEIKKAYRRMAQMYHPDKVAGLAPEFSLIAETRMREINSAYEELVKTA